MKTKITIKECYAKTLWYSGTVEIHSSDKIDEFLSEECDKEINFSIAEEWNDNAESYVGTESITFQDDLPESIDEQELKQQILDEFNKI